MSKRNLCTRFGKVDCSFLYWFCFHLCICSLYVFVLNHIVKALRIVQIQLVFNVISKSKQQKFAGDFFGENDIFYNSLSLRIHRIRIYLFHEKIDNLFDFLFGLQTIRVIIHIPFLHSVRDVKPFVVMQTVPVSAGNKLNRVFFLHIT